jgi:hypothetical protein
MDVKRIALAASTQTNWMPRALGAMSLRPGLEKVEESLSSKRAKHIPFVFAFDDQALIEITPGFARILIDDKAVTRPTNNTSLANGTFETDLTSWTDSDETGATSAQKTADGKGVMSLIGTRFTSAIRDQEVFVFDAQSSPGKVVCGEPKVYGRKSRIIGEPGAAMMTAAPVSGIHQHAVRIVIHRGPVTFSIGSSLGGEDYIEETELDEGTHSIAFTPRGNFFLRFRNKDEIDVMVDSVSIESSGDLTIPVPYRDEDLKNIRASQVGDLVYVSCDGYQQRVFERRGTRSWSFVKYLTKDGPFNVINTTETTLTADALNGEVTLTSSENLFNSGHVGSLWKVTSEASRASAVLSGDNQFSDAILVTGLSANGGREIFKTITGTWSGTIQLQRSFDNQLSWQDAAASTINVADIKLDDNQNNVDVHYRIGFKEGDYTSGQPTVLIYYVNGGIDGILRVHTYTSPTSVSGSAVQRFGETISSTHWYEPIWSDDNGWPTSVELYEGRLWWFGRDWISGSVTDELHSFDDDIEGDSAPIIRTVGKGPSDNISWGLGLQRLLIGLPTNVFSIRASAFDEPLSVSEFNFKTADTKGATDIAALAVGARGVHVDRSTFRLWQLELSSDNITDYSPSDLSLLVPDIGKPGFTHIAVQEHADTRIHGIRSDGTVAVLVYDPGEDVRAWIEVETGDADGANGVVTDCVVLPGKEEDKVYYQVLRVIDGKPRHFLERWALESDCIGGTVSEQADSFVRFSYPTPQSTISGLEHLEGQTVIVWTDGKCLDDADGDIATFTVSSGAITPTDGGSATTVSEGVVGIQYEAPFKSAELPYGATLGTTLTRRQQINQIGLLLSNTHHLGLQYGRSTSALDNLPQVIDGSTVSADTVHSFLSEQGVTFPGENSADTRLHLKAVAPRPVTIMAAVLELDTTDS